MTPRGSISTIALVSYRRTSLSLNHGCTRFAKLWAGKKVLRCSSNSPVLTIADIVKMKRLKNGYVADVCFGGLRCWFAQNILLISLRMTRK